MIVIKAGPHEHDHHNGLSYHVERRVSREVLDVIATIIERSGHTPSGVIAIHVPEHEGERHAVECVMGARCVAGVVEGDLDACARAFVDTIEAPDHRDDAGVYDLMQAKLARVTREK